MGEAALHLPGKVADPAGDQPDLFTVCPRSSYPFFILTYYLKWVTSFLTDAIKIYFLSFI